MVETPLGRALREHREGCEKCADKACGRYLQIAVEMTRQRVIWEGPTMAHSRLSVQEATL